MSEREIESLDPRYVAARLREVAAHETDPRVAERLRRDADQVEHADHVARRDFDVYCDECRAERRDRAEQGERDV